MTLKIIFKHLKKCSNLKKIKNKLICFETLKKKFKNKLGVFISNK